MSISVSASGSMSPEQQFAPFKKHLFSVSSVTSGVGATTSGNQSMSGHYYQVKAPDTEIGYAALDIYTPLLNRGATNYNGIDWAKGVVFGFRVLRKVGTSADSNSQFSAILGKSYNSSGATNRGALTAGDKGCGIIQNGNGALILQAATGGSVFNVTSSFTPVYQQAYDVVIKAFGGVAYLYVNDVLVATNNNCASAGSGTGESQLMALWITCENSAILTGNNHSAVVTDYFLSYLS